MTQPTPNPQENTEATLRDGQVVLVVCTFLRKNDDIWRELAVGGEIISVRPPDLGGPQFFPLDGLRDVLVEWTTITDEVECFCVQMYDRAQHDAELEGCPLAAAHRLRERTIALLPLLGGE